MSQHDLQGKVCLVTGGNSGIGRATSILLAQQKVKVAVLGRDSADVEEVADEINQKHGEAIPLAADITDESAMVKAVERLNSHWGTLDIVVANAGINGVWAPLDDLNVDDWRKTIDVNLTGTFITLKTSVPAMKSGGSVIVMSSVNGTRIFSNSGATAYAASKAGQVALAKMLALELAKEKIRVNVICPGAIMTPIFDKTIEKNLEEAQEPVEFPEGDIPLTDGKPGSPEQVASVVLFLAGGQSSHVTGSVVYVDGAESLLQG